MTRPQFGPRRQRPTIMERIMQLALYNERAAERFAELLPGGPSQHSPAKQAAALADVARWLRKR